MSKNEILFTLRTNTRAVLCFDSGKKIQLDKRKRWHAFPQHVECEHFDESNSKINNGMLLPAPAYHVCTKYRIPQSWQEVSKMAP